ncbi:MAG: NAD-dependent epimerase/dehydratase family protein [Lentisphaerota bacterium]
MLPVGPEQYDDHVGMSCDLLINANGNSRKYFSLQYPLKDFDLSVASTARSLFDFNYSCYAYLSSVDVYPCVSDPAQNSEDARIDERQLSHYGFHKFMAEELVRHYAPSWLILRLGGLIGPRLRKNAIYDMLHHLPLRVHPDSAYQYLDTRIMAKCLFDLYARGSRDDTINLAGTGAMALRDVAALIPDFVHKQMENEAPIERYEVNTDKAMKLFSLPTTKAMVTSFIQDTLSGQFTQQQEP